MSLEKHYIKILDTVKKDIEKVVQLQIDSINLAEPLRSQLLKILNAPSKHIRPLTAFLYLKASNYEIDNNQILYQSAIETAHNASLIHDDIIDESTKRRNSDTLNSKFSNQLAVITGDWLLAVALKKVLKISIPKLADLFCDTIQEMTQGEINQYFTKYEIPTLKDYITKSENKTAKLFETAISGSMIIAKSKDSGLDFAKNFGIAFQIRDDLINCLTDKSDIENGIYTAPVIFSNSKEITQNGIEKTKDLLNNYLNNAEKSINYLPDNKYKSALKEILRIMKYE